MLNSIIEYLAILSGGQSPRPAIISMLCMLIMLHTIPLPPNGPTPDLYHILVSLALRWTCIGIVIVLE